MIDEKKIILNQVKRDKNTIYGAQAIKKHIGLLARPTVDYDSNTPRPRASANKLKNTLNRKAPGSPYFSKPAMHPGTYKVKNVGRDKKPNTKDDLEVADFSRMTQKRKTQVINGIRYTQLSESEKDKRASLRDKQFVFRHEKDRGDLERIKTHKRLRKFGVSLQ